ncbi:hypothetical protein D3C87_1287530 [compost metagenome]
MLEGGRGQQRLIGCWITDVLAVLFSGQYAISEVVAHAAHRQLSAAHQQGVVDAGVQHFAFVFGMQARLFAEDEARTQLHRIGAQRQ